MSFHYDKYTSSVDIDDVYDTNWYDEDWYDEDWYDEDWYDGSWHDDKNCFKQTDIHNYRDTISSKTYFQYLNQNINKKY